VIPQTVLTEAAFSLTPSYPSVRHPCLIHVKMVRRYQPNF